MYQLVWSSTYQLDESESLDYSHCLPTFSPVMFESSINRVRAYCQKPGANPASEAATEKSLMEKPYNTLPDLGSKEGTQSIICDHPSLE